MDTGLGLKISPETIVTPATYITAESTVSFSITNVSSRIIKFQWRKHPSIEAEREAMQTVDLYDPLVRLNSKNILLFNSDVFHFEDLEGEIWPKSTVRYTIKFQAFDSGIKEETAYLTDIETNVRMPVKLSGDCLPLHASFSTKTINTEFIYLDHSYEYEVYLENTGMAPLDFTYIEKETDLKYEFWPKKGHIDVGCKVKIHIKLYALKVGSFFETFTYQIDGSKGEFPQISISGRIIGPKIEVDLKEISFPKLSLDFMYSKVFRITNVSDNPFDFIIDIDRMNTFESREITLYPNEGVIRPHKYVDIRVEVIPIAKRNYRGKLIISNPKFCNNIMEIPVYASCDYPVITLESSFIDAGNLFYGHEYNFQVVMVNNTKLVGKYECVESGTEEDYGIELKSSQMAGIIEEHSTRVFPFTVRLTQLGSHEIKRRIIVSGIKDNFVEFTFKASCIGPTLEFSTMDLNFGDTKVLKPKTLHLLIQNTSLIDAEFTMNFMEETTVFSINETEGVVKAGETKSIDVTAKLDDICTFQANLQILFKYLSPFIVTMKAKGSGVFIVPSIPLDQIDFGHLFVNEDLVKTFSLDNQGRRPLELRWVLAKPKLDTTSKNFSYSIVPESCVIEPKQKVDYTLTIKAGSSCNFEINPQCTTTLNKARVDLFLPHIVGNFIQVALHIEKPKLEFRYTHDGDMEEFLQNQNMTTEKLATPSKELMKKIVHTNSFTNNSPMAIHVTTTSPTYFTLSEEDFHIEPGERKEFTVTFDPSFKTEFSSEVIDRRVNFSVGNSPLHFYMDLKAIIVFPNIIFSRTSIDFGELAASTELSQTIHMKNNNHIKTEYNWQLLENNGEEKIFDIIPIRGTLEPHSDEDIHFSFYAKKGENGGNAMYQGTAICHVTGGPDYMINLKGTAACYEYVVEPKCITIDPVPANEAITTAFTFKNRCSFKLSYQIIFPSSVAFQSLNVTPMQGELGRGEQQIFKINIITGRIKQYNDYVKIKIGDFAEERVYFRINTYYPRISYSLEHVAKEGQELGTFKAIEKYEHNSISDRLSELVKRSSYIISSKNSGFVNTPTKFKGVIISTFHLDMGELTLGNDYTKQFEVKYLSHKKGSFYVLTANLAETGFSIPETVFKDVSPNDIISITVNFSSEERTTFDSNDIFVEFPIIMDEDFGYMIRITAKVIMPNIIISNQMINFEDTIIGQTKIITIQLQNLNDFECAYTIKPAERTNVIQRSVKAEKAVFVATPTQGILPPISYANIDVAFTPTKEKTYSMQLPICLKFNSECSYVSLKGSGVQLKIKCNPDKAGFKMTMPFCEPETIPIEITNPTNYDLDVYSKQFDGLLTLRMNGQEEKEPEVVEEPPPKYADVSSVCIIVDGPPSCGKSELSRVVSEHMDGIPIIDLSEVWKDIPPHAKPMVYIETLKKAISGDEFENGFVVDGLSGIPEPSETESFLVHTIKTKGIAEELQNDPLVVIPHKEITSREQSLAYLKEVLTGQYLFIIEINANEQNIAARLETIEKEKKQKEEEELKIALEKILTMTEAEYNALTDEEKEEADKKREEYRSKLLGYEKPQPVQVVANNKAPKKPTKKSLLPTDPIGLGTLIFHYTQGCIVSEVLKPNENYKIIDVDCFMGRVKEEPTSIIVPEADVTASTESFATPVVSTPRTKRPSKVTDSEKILIKIPDSIRFTKFSTKVKNSIVISGECSVKQQNDEMKNFLPSMKEFKKRVFMLTIKPARIVVNERMSKASLDCRIQPKDFIVLAEQIQQKQEVVVQEVVQPKRNRGSHHKHVTVVAEEEEDLLEVTTPILAPRWHIEPGETAKVDLQFVAMSPGHFEDKLSFGILNALAPTFPIRLAGDCAYPDIERSFTTIFPVVVPRLKPRTENAFVESLSTFHFGHVIIVQAKNLKASQAVYKQTLHFYNPSPFNAEIQCYFTEPVVKNTWIVDQPNFMIPSKGFADIVVGFNPIAADIYKNTLMLSIKDNPELFPIKFAGQGCIPCIVTTTQNIDYDRLLIRQEKTLKIDLKNKGLVPACWRVKGGNTLGPTFSFSSLEGILGPGRSTTVDIMYSSSKPFQIKKAIQIDVLDRGKVRVFSGIHVNVSAETFDANFELILPKGEESVNFGEIKINKEGTSILGIKSHSKYPLMYKFEMPKAATRKLLKIEPMEGGIQPDKPVNITFVCQANNATRFENAKGVNLKVTDSVSGSEIANIPVPFSLNVRVSEYEVLPNNNIDFGATCTNTSSTKTFQLHNKGSFPFDFELVNTDPDLPSEPEGPRTNNPRDKRRNNLKSSNLGGKSRKSKIQSIIIKDFAISPSVGSINPGDTMTFTAETFPTKADLISSSFAIKITDAAPDLADGIPFTISTTAFRPAIETNNLEQIFPNMPIVVKNDLSQKDANAIILPDKIVHFASTTLGISSTINVRLTNINPIPCIVDLAFKGTNQKYFSLSAKQLEIEPSSTSDFQIRFTPKEQMNYSAKLEINVKNGNQTTFVVEGTGGLPEILITHHDEPVVDSVLFGQVLLGSRRTREVTIKNVGILDAPIEIEYDSNPNFEVLCDKTFMIERNKQVVIPVTFFPSKVRHEVLPMKIKIQHKQCEPIVVNFCGDGNSEEILFDGLPHDGSDLIFNDMIVGSQQKIKFTMRSCSKSVIKYTWGNVPDFTFIPKVGHIKPGQSKIVTVVFNTDHTVKYNGVKAVLSTTKIVLNDPDGPDWDDSMTEKKVLTRRVIFLNTPAPPSGEPKNTGRKFPAHGRKQKVDDKKQTVKIPPGLETVVNTPLTDENADDTFTYTDVKAEPAFTPTKERRDIVLRIYAAADIVKYTLNTENIEFKPIMMFQKIQSSVKLTNNSKIEINYHWFTFKLQSMHSIYNESPFTMIPSSGALAPGETKVFVCEFCPKEVDEFYGTMRCEIPFLTKQPPPELSVSGMSRRPICHIEVDPSDYITSGRRMPEFTYPLPEDIRVVELSSKGVGDRVVKRIELINTTGTPYEFILTQQYESKQDVIQCETPLGLISSGKSHHAVFSYHPTTNKIVESLWNFSIPSFNVNVPILVIGKVNK